MNKFEAVIGLEIHAELKTASKMFCSCKNDPFNSQQNVNICPICLGMPGMLPVLNRQAIEWTILTGLSLNCKIAEFTKWDRKNYFYPDLPKGYQISQYDLPLCSGGYIEITNNQKPNTKQIPKPNNQNSKTKIGITRIHLEEDTGTSKHPEGRIDVDYSLMDYNRAGVPLMELVTDAITLPIDQVGPIAKEFCQKYQLILRYLNVADADMEKGQMRCEANISVKPTGRKEFGTKVEVKNLNSFRSVEKAIKYEIERQINEIEDGVEIIQETRGWNDIKNKTYTMRVKETSADYRYFPEPDLPPVVLQTTKRKTTRLDSQKARLENSKLKTNVIYIDEIKKQLPELPDEKLRKYIQEYKLREVDAEVMINDIEKSQYFEKCLILDTKYKILASKIANWVINEIPNLDIEPKFLVEIVQLINDNKITGKIAKEILPEVKNRKSPLLIIKEKGLEQITDDSAIEKIVDQILSKNSEIVSKIKLGQTQVIGFLVGQVMKESKGQINPKMVNDILKRKLIGR